MRIVAIGGGDEGTSDEKPYNLKEIYEEVVKMTAKAHPRLLFIGFTERANFVFSAVKRNFMELGAQCEYLSYRDFENQKTIEGKFKRADIIYIGGGNTLMVMRDIKKYGLDKYLELAKDRGAILSGKSAGAIVYHKFGSSDSRKFKSNENKYVKVAGLGFVDALFCPHYSSSKRVDDLPRMMKNMKVNALAVDNCSALVIDGDEFTVVKSDKNANAYKCFYKNGEFVKEQLSDTGKIEYLFDKN
jgi:dipeptidase E